MPPKRPVNRTAGTNGLQEENTQADSGSEQNIALQSPALNGTQSSATGPSSNRRLDTLQRPALPLSASSNGRGGTARPLARPRGIGRRSQQGRAELEKAELERKQAEAATKAQAKPWLKKRDNTRGRGTMRGRMRGGYVGENERRPDGPAVVSGPFSLGQVMKDSGRRAFGGSAQSAGSQGRGGTTTGGRTGTGAASTSTHGSQVKQEGHSGGDAVMTDVHIKQEDGGYISSDADDDRSGGQKLNVDTLVDLTVDDDDVVLLPPVRIQRVEHKERMLVANTDPAMRGGSAAIADSNDTISTDRRRTKYRSKELTVKRNPQRYRGTYTDSSSSEEEVQVKQEGHGEPHPQDEVQSSPTSPEARRRAKASIRNDSFHADTQRPSFQTKEEELEWDIRQRDLRILHAELGQLTLPSAGVDTESDPTNDPRKDKMYLFQFPAILPTLCPVKPKQEDGDVNMEDVPEISAAAKPTTATKADTKPPQSQGGGGGAAIPSGAVGKLRVHKSGRAYLDWGGIPMEVSMGQEASFLQDVVIVDSKKDSKAGAEPDAEHDQYGGAAMSMGQVKGRFVVVPQFDAIFEQAY